MNIWSLDRWLPQKEVPQVNMRIATKEEKERMDSSLSPFEKALHAECAAFYTRKTGAVVLTSRINEQDFSKAIVSINHEMMHHLLTNFVSGKVSHQMDLLTHTKFTKVGKGNLTRLSTFNILDQYCGGNKNER